MIQIFFSFDAHGVSHFRVKNNYVMVLQQLIIAHNL